MEDNEAMEGKRLEIHMFEQKVLEAIQIADEQEADNSIIDNGQMQFEIKIKREGKKIKINAFGEEILTLEDGNFNYNIEGLKNIEQKLAENPEFDYKQFGLPDIEYLETLEKQKEEQQRNEEDLSEDMEEKEEEEPEQLNEEEQPEVTEEKIAKRHNVSSNKVTNISTQKKVTEKIKGRFLK